MKITYKLARAAVWAAFADTAHADSDVQALLERLGDTSNIQDVQQVLDDLNEKCEIDMASPATIEECVADLLAD